MICEKYNALTTREKIEFIGKIHHAIINSNTIFEEAAYLVNSAEKAGLFDNVTFLPDTSIN